MTPPVQLTQAMFAKGPCQCVSHTHVTLLCPELVIVTFSAVTENIQIQFFEETETE